MDLPEGGTTVDAGLSRDEQLKRISDRMCSDVYGRRIVDGALVLWQWTPEGGWKRPHWWARKGGQ